MSAPFSVVALTHMALAAFASLLLLPLAVSLPRSRRHRLGRVLANVAAFVFVLAAAVLAKSAAPSSPELSVHGVLGYALLAAAGLHLALELASLSPSRSRRYAAVRRAGGYALAISALGVCALGLTSALCGHGACVHAGALFAGGQLLALAYAHEHWHTRARYECLVAEAFLVGGAGAFAAGFGERSAGVLVPALAAAGLGLPAFLYLVDVQRARPVAFVAHGGVAASAALVLALVLALAGSFSLAITMVAFAFSRALGYMATAGLALALAGAQPAALELDAESVPVVLVVDALAIAAYASTLFWIRGLLTVPAESSPPRDSLDARVAALIVEDEHGP